MPLKRTPLKRRTPLRNGKPITAKTAPRRSKIRPVNPKRKAAKDKRNFGPEAERVRAMPCLVYYAMARDGLIGGIVDVTCRGDVEAAHVSARGGGGAKGDKTRLVPLCAAHHREAGEATRPGHDELLLDGEEPRETQRQAFERRYGLRLDDEADRIALEHPRPLGIRGLADRWADWLAVADACSGCGTVGVTVSYRPSGADVCGSCGIENHCTQTTLCPLAGHERDALLGWVHRRMTAYSRGAAASGVLWLPPDMAEWMAMDLFEDDDDSGEANALLLCEAAAERFGGWPT